MPSMCCSHFQHWSLCNLNSCRECITFENLSPLAYIHSEPSQMNCHPSMDTRLSLLCKMFQLVVRHLRRSPSYQHLLQNTLVWAINSYYYSYWSWNYRSSKFIGRAHDTSRPKLRSMDFRWTMIQFYTPSWLLITLVCLVELDHNIPILFRHQLCSTKSYSSLSCLGFCNSYAFRSYQTILT